MCHSVCGVAVVVVEVVTVCVCARKSEDNLGMLDLSFYPVGSGNHTREVRFDRSAFPTEPKRFV